MQKKKTLLSSKDVQTVGHTPFLSCATQGRVCIANDTPERY